MTPTQTNDGRVATAQPLADDAIVHCRTEAEAQEVRAAIAARFEECGLELHPEKTQIVYCKDGDRRRTYPNEKFDFLGYTFRPRRSKNRKGKFFINFSPAVSDKAVKAIRAEIRSWNLHLRSDKSIEDLSRMFNPIIRGWLQYYGRFYRSALSADASTGSIIGPLGRSEIQEAAQAFAQGDTLGRAHLET
jgi:RNA-directed DNA polymerase